VDELQSQNIGVEPLGRHKIGAYARGSSHFRDSHISHIRVQATSRGQQAPANVMLQ